MIRAPPAISESQNYPTQLLALIGHSASQLVRSPTALPQQCGR